MSYDKIATICFISVCALLCACLQTTGAFACLAVGIMLFGFILWLDRNRVDDKKDLQDQITGLKNRMEAMQIARLAR